MIKWYDTYDQQVKAMLDADLIVAYFRAEREVRNRDVDGLVAEINRRKLDL